MKKTFTIIYSVLVSLVLIFSITYFAVNIYNENAHGELRTQVRFEKVVTGVKNAIGKSNITASEKSRQIENTIGDTKDFAYITITNNGKAVYTYPEDFEGSEQISSNLIIPYNRNLTIDGNKIVISCGMYSLRPSSIFEYAKISFFIILIVTLLTIILIIYNNHFSKDKKQASVSKKKKAEIVYDEENDYETEESSNEYVETSDTDDKDTEAEEVIEAEDEPEEEVIKAEEKDEAPTYGKIEVLPVKDYEPVELEEAHEDTSDKGLFSPDTGLGWESYLMTRLDNELNRATASELDLSLFIIKLGGLSRKNPLTKKICDYLIVEFQFKDLLFEYKDDSICGLKISMNIDNAITFAEKLVDEIKKLTQNENLTVLAGVTTRGIRMVSGERLLKEADEAIKHAAADPSCPVVGFRADAVKYRKFLEKN